MKFDLLRDFFDLNQGLDRVMHGLERMEKVRFFRTQTVRYARAEIETARADIDREFFDHFSEIVENDARWAYKFRREYDRRIQDPFDFYLELKEREDARRRHGLPPRAVLLPGWDQDDEHDRKLFLNRPRTARRRHQRTSKAEAPSGKTRKADR